MNKIITKLPVFEDTETIKAKEQQTKQENVESMKAAAKEIEAMFADANREKKAKEDQWCF